MREEDSGELHSDSMGFGEDDEESKSVASTGVHMASFHHSGSSKDHQHGNNLAPQNINNKFHQRMEQEDAMFHEKLVEGRAARRGDGTLILHTICDSVFKSMHVHSLSLPTSNSQLKCINLFSTLCSAEH